MQSVWVYCEHPTRDLIFLRKSSHSRDILQIFIYLFIYLYILPQRKNITEKKEKKITKISNLQGRKSYDNSSALNIVLSDLTFVTDRVARKPNKS